MTDIDKLEKSIEFRRNFGAFCGDSQIILNCIAEIRRLRRESEMLHQIVDDAIAMAAHRRTGLLGPDRVEHRKCVLGCGENGKGYMRVSHRREGECNLRPLYWVSCGYCGHNGPIRMTEDEAWAAWDGVE